MNLRYFVINAFTQGLFGGNPAGVCLLPDWLPDEQLMAMAASHRLSETAFVVRTKDAWELRWFTPAVEVELCGHATLAAGKVMLHELSPAWNRIDFQTRFTGAVSVSRRSKGKLELDFPARQTDETADPELIASVSDAIRADVKALRTGEKWIVRVADAATVRGLQPDMDKVAALEAFGLIVTAEGEDDDGKDPVDFVSRFFAPKAGVPEDPVTGSAHCALTPYWANELGKTALHAKQLSERGGELWCELKDDRVLIGGYALTYIAGHIRLKGAS